MLKKSEQTNQKALGTWLFPQVLNFVTELHIANEITPTPPKIIASELVFKTSIYR
ncbi:MAG: hypothetical protein ACM37W_26010 [Actinomycetota bacterium]